MVGHYPPWCRSGSVDAGTRPPARSGEIDAWRGTASRTRGVCVDCGTVPQGLTIVAAIRPGDEERLRGALRPLGDDIRGRRLADPSQPPRIDFSRMRGCHFARFAILDDPDRGPDRRRLLYSSNYDGDLEDHIAELAAATPDIDVIWGCCEAYTTRARFGEFLRAHRAQPEAFYIAFRGQTVAQVRQMVALRRAAESVLDQAAAPPASAR